MVRECSLLLDSGPYVQLLKRGCSFHYTYTMRCISREQPQTKSMEENLASTSSSQPLSPPPSFESTKLKYQNPSTESSISSPLPPSVTRLWRPAAQRNLRNQWSKMASCRQQWKSFSSSARSHATSIVNSYLSQRQFPLKTTSLFPRMFCHTLSYIYIVHISYIYQLD